MRHETPAVWFTTNDLWEPTTAVFEVDHLGRLGRHFSMQECHEQVGLIRFVVDESSAPHTWRHHKRHGGMDRRTARSLYAAAIAVGSSPPQYRLSYDPVQAAKWLAVETWDGAHWRSISGLVFTAA